MHPTHIPPSFEPFESHLRDFESVLSRTQVHIRIYLAHQNTAMFRLVGLLLIVLMPLLSVGQKDPTVSGEVRDAVTGESIIGALVSVQNAQKGVSTNVYGFYSLTLPKGKVILQFNMIGYAPLVREFELVSDLKMDVQLTPESKVMNTVTIEGTKSDNTRSTDVGKIGLEVESIKKLPVLLGEVDILKTITLLPGVQSSGEGNAGFYVRGGGVDQNLILLDNATVYNASHLFGFFSVFNGDAVKNLELTKGGVPSNYGTRLASVVDIALKEGNSKEFKTTGGIGTISSRLTIEGPIKKDTSSFIISARRTYIDILLKPLISEESNFSGSGYYFYDLNAKINYRLGPKDQLFLSGYFGRDVFDFNSKQTGFSTRIPWGNSTGTLRWNRVVNPKLFVNTTATFTDYQFAFEGGQEDFEFRLNSGIRDYGGKMQWNYYPNYLHNIKWGAEYTKHLFTPNNAYARSGDTEFELGDQVELHSHEWALFALDEFDINEKLRINAGLRYSGFVHVGPFTRYIKVEDSGLSTPPPPTAVKYEKGDKIKQYGGWEPRLNFRYALNATSSIKGGYMRNLQYIHLTSLSPTSLPTDVWLPSTDRLPPQIGNQVSLGYFRNFKNDTYETSVEVYYKTMDNQTEYAEGSSPEQTVNDNIDNLLVFGRGNSYGIEFFVKKRTGQLNGWVGYTLAKTTRFFDAIDNGDPFPPRWDRRHDISVVMNYKLTKRLDLGFVFVYGTGNAITLPVQRYLYEGAVRDVYGERNSFRMAPYHRADISFTLYPKSQFDQKDPESGLVIKPASKFKNHWNFSVYNLYNRRNPYFIYFGNSGDLAQGTLEINAYQVSLFPILPSVTWNFEF